MYENIPAELKALRQWIAVDMSVNHKTNKPHKSPLHPTKLYPASIHRPEDWGTFEEAVASGKPIGFMFTLSDPYAFIDLDDPEKMREKGGAEGVANAAALNQLIYETFESYAEVSQSGKGVHIICRGTTPVGHKRDTVELYTSARMGIFTGNVIKPLPITDQQELISNLFMHMGGAATAAGIGAGAQSRYTDDELVMLACTAKNADKVKALCRGEWKDHYSSQSEADLALMSVFAFYSPDNEQCMRVFRMTSLGQRDKAKPKTQYLDRTLKVIRNREQQPIDFSKLEVPTFNTPDLAIAHVERYQQIPYTFPPGAMGALAEWFLANAIRPVPEVALAGALALTAGLISRTYNVSGSGLNQYLVIVGATGTGKEGATDGIHKMVNAMRPFLPMVGNAIGPGIFASAQGLVRVLSDKPCFLSILGEFGQTLHAWSDPRQSSAVTMIRRVLLDTFAKSGHNQMMAGSAYSDKEKNTKDVLSPNINILGDATPESLYDALNVGLVAEGLIPRFTIVEYKTDRADTNENRQTTPPPELVKWYVELARIGLFAQSNNTVSNVQIQPDALQVLKAFDKLCDKRIRNNSEIERQLWNRGHIKSLKVAALIAAANDPHNPSINVEAAKWAVNFIQREIEDVIGRFNNDDYGTGENRQEAHLREAIDSYSVMSDHTKLVTYRVPPQLIGKPVIPYCYLRRKLKRLSAFNLDRRGAVMAMQLALQDACRAGILQQVSEMQARTDFDTISPIYVVGPSY